MSVILAPHDYRKKEIGAITGHSQTATFTAQITAVQAYSTTTGMARYTVATTVNLKNLPLDSDIVSSACTNASNNGTFKIAKVDDANHYVYILNQGAVAEVAPPATAVLTFTQHVKLLHTKTLLNGAEGDVVALVDTVDVAAATNYYPSSAGLSMEGYKNLSIQGMTSGGVTTTIEVTNDTAAVPDWVDITLSAYNIVTNAVGAASFVDTNFLLDFEALNVKAFRIKSVTSDATNAVQYCVRRNY